MKKGIIILICLTLLLGCVHGAKTPNTQGTGTPELTEVRLALNPSGHIFNLIAEEQGYLVDEGISVVYVETKTDAEVFEGIRNGTIDVASNSGRSISGRGFAFS